jgi:hypothetical protein
MVFVISVCGLEKGLVFDVIKILKIGKGISGFDRG